MIRCCKDCQRRQVGCHATCQNYIEEKNAHDTKRDQLREMKREINSSYGAPWSPQKRRRLCGH